MDPNYTTVKTSLGDMDFKAEFRPALNKLVLIVNEIVRHAYAFAKFIFIHELNKNSQFSFEQHVTAKFFEEVILSLIERRKTSKPLAEITTKYRSLIDQYQPQYLKDTTFVPIPLKYSQQIAKYEAQKMQTAYVNNVKNQHGNRVRMFMNKILKKEENIKSTTKAMQDNGFTKEEISSSIKMNIINVCTKIKTEITAKRVIAPADLIDEEGRRRLDRFFKCYENVEKFENGSIYYDIKKYPGRHMNAFILIASICEEAGWKGFNPFPLRKSYVPSHITIDNKILNYHILKETKMAKGADYEQYWRNVVDLEKRCFKGKGQFYGLIETDGISASIIKRHHQQQVLNASLESEKVKYIEKLEPAELQATQGKCVLIDPGRGDLHYMMHEKSTTATRNVLRYTRNQYAIETKSRRFGKLRRFMKPRIISSLEARFSSLNRSTLKPSVYKEFLMAKSTVSRPLTSYYSENQDFREMADPALECNEDQDKELHGLKSELTSLVFLLKEKKVANSIKTESYKQLVTDTNNYLKDEEEKTLEAISATRKRLQISNDQIRSKLSILPYRKLKLSSYIRKQKLGKKLCKSIRSKFGSGAVLVLGDWNSGNVKYQEPIPGKGWRRLFKKEGFDLYLINEYNTSKLCSECGNDLKKFKEIVNPRPYRRSKYPTIICHGLLKCNKCKEGEKLWNRDQNAVLNFRAILSSLRETGERPLRFSESRTQSRKRKNTEEDTRNPKK